MLETIVSFIAHVFRNYVPMARWVEWREEDLRKVPYTPGTSLKASSSDPSSWRRFDECRGKPCGIVFTGDGLGGVDLDACRDPASGKIAPWATEIIEYFATVK